MNHVFDVLTSIGAAAYCTPSGLDELNRMHPDRTEKCKAFSAGITADLMRSLSEYMIDPFTVRDYLKMLYELREYLCISAVSLLLANLNIERQKATLPEAKSVQPSAELPRSNRRFERGTADARCMTRPFEERLHVMRLKDTEELRPCYMKSRDAMKRLCKVGNPEGFQVSAESRNRGRSIQGIERRAAEPTMDKYDLIYSEAVRSGESMVDVCKRYHLNVPTGFHGYAPTVSDVLVLQTRRGCHALIIDSLGFEVVERFVRPPG